MKRIALLVCGVLLLVSTNVQAQCSGGKCRPTQQVRYTQPVQYTQPVRYTQTARVAPTTSTTYTSHRLPVAPASYSASPSQPAKARTLSYNTSTAQGVANIMASSGRVGHWGGNSGYEGCGAGSSPQAAYNNCCYSRSGMTTVDVGYARGANGMWYCCRRYR